MYIYIHMHVYIHIMCIHTYVQVIPSLLGPPGSVLVQIVSQASRTGLIHGQPPGRESNTPEQDLLRPAEHPKELPKCASSHNSGHSLLSSSCGKYFGLLPMSLQLGLCMYYRGTWTLRVWVLWKSRQIRNTEATRKGAPRTT